MTKAVLTGAYAPRLPDQRERENTADDKVVRGSRTTSLTLASAIETPGAPVVFRIVSPQIFSLF